MHMLIPNVSTPVLVLNATHYGALGLSRSLGRLGIAVHNQAALGSAAAFSSRYSRRNLVWDLDAKGVEQSIEFLLATGRQLPQPAVLIPTCDVTAMLVADHDRALRQYFLFPRQQRELVHTLCSKKGLYHLAKSLRIPTPDTTFPVSRGEVLGFLESARFPIVLKTIKNSIGNQATYGLKIIAYNSKELLSLYDEFENPDHPNLMLQEYIPGSDETVCFFNGYFNESSDCIFGFTAKKLRQWPAYRGVTTLGICLKNEVIETSTNQFMKAIGYRGILDIGYRYDARDGLHKVLDVNPRIGCTFRLFAAENGMDVARALYLDLTGQPIRVARVHEGRKWVAEDIDLLSSAQSFLDRKLTPGEWIKSFRGVQESAYFAADDPVPFLAMCFQRAKKLLARLFRKLMRRHPWQTRSPVYSSRT